MFSLQLPDAFPGNVSFAGNVYSVSSSPSGQAYTPAALSDGSGGSTLALPAVPGSGTTYAILEADTTTGVCTWKTSSSAYPSPDAGNVQLFQMAIPAGATIPWQCSLTTGTF